MQEQETTGDKQAGRFRVGTSGNPKGRPKALPTLSRTIQDMLIDEAFERTAPENQRTPLARIASLAIQEAMDMEIAPDARQKAREWIAVHGYGIPSATNRINE